MFERKVKDMYSNSVLEVVSQPETSKTVLEGWATIPVGTIIAWAIAISIIIGTIATGIIKLYKVFTKYRDLKDKSEAKDKLINDLVEREDETRKLLRGIQKTLDEQREVNYKQLKYFIVTGCTEAINKGYVTSEQLKSLEEMFEEYVAIYRGNGYVKGLMERVRKLDIKD